MTTEDMHIRRAAEATLRAIRPGPDDDAHLDDEVLDALAARRLDEADRDWAEAHLEACAQCAEDLADRRAVQRSIDALAGPARKPVSAPAPASGWWRLAAPLGLTAAAAILLAVGLTRDEAPAPQAAVAPGPATVADALAPEDRALVERVLGAGKVELPEDIAFLQGREGTLLGGGGTETRLLLEAPVGTAVSGARPEFRWSRVDQARSYTVHVFDEAFREFARAQVTTTAWVPDADLAPGAVYAWQVTAHTPDGDVVAPAPPRPEARFRVLRPAEAEAITRARTRLGSDRLTLGILEARAGLLDDAAASFRRAQVDAATRAQAATLLASLPGPRF